MKEFYLMRHGQFELVSVYNPVEEEYIYGGEE